MAIQPSVEYPAQIDLSDPTGYPYGKAKNQTSEDSGDGTPLEEKMLNDVFGFQQALLALAAIVPSGTPDKVGASQYLDALLTVTHRATRAEVKASNWRRTKLRDLPDGGVVGSFNSSSGGVAPGSRFNFTIDDAPDFVLSSGRVISPQKGRFLVQVSFEITAGGAGFAIVTLNYNGSSIGGAGVNFTGAGTAYRTINEVIELDNLSGMIELVNDASSAINLSIDASMTVSYIGALPDNPATFVAATYCPGAGYAGQGAWVFGGSGGATQSAWLHEDPTLGGAPTALDTTGILTSIVGLASSASKVVAVGGHSSVDKAAVWTNPGDGGSNLTATGVDLPATGFASPSFVVYSEAFDQFVVVGFSTDKFAYSNSSVSAFTLATISGTWGVSVQAIAVGQDGDGNERIVALGSTDHVIYSDDGGETWTVSAEITDFSGDRSLAYSGVDDAWLSVGSGGQVWRSDDGVVWTQLADLPFTASIGHDPKLVCDGGQWLVIKGEHVATSRDGGASWRSVPLKKPATAGFGYAFHGGGRFVLLAASTRDMFVSLRID